MFKLLLKFLFGTAFLALVIFLAIYLSLVLSLLGYGTFSYFSDIANKRNDEKTDEYRYWHELVAKNPKPEDVSQAEFILKNKEGYCWRDKTYYSEKELKERAMVHFSETLLNHIRRAKEEKLIIDGDYIEQGSADYCKKSKSGCRLWFMPTNQTNQDFQQFLTDNRNYSPLYTNYLIDHNAKEIFTPVDLIYYTRKSDKYALFHNGYSLSMILGADCCSIVKQADVKAIPKKRLISAADNFSDQGEIPTDINEITEYGVGVYYFSADYFSYGYLKETIGQDGRIKYEPDFYNIKSFYLLSNCGEVLFKPYYSFR